MRVIPAIDLRGGRCVRLQQGDFERETRYDADPVELAEAYREAGARWLHVVDLDGALEGSMGNRATIEKIAAIDGLRVQCGGGLRSETDVASILESGVDRAVVGSVAVREPARVRDWIERFGGERINVALDVRWVETEFRVAVSGWTETAGATLWEALGAFAGADLRHVLCTDISRDGMLSGPNVVLYRSLVDRMPKLAVQASGGVSGANDLPALEQVGVAGVIVGKALLDGRLDRSVLAAKTGRRR